MRAVDYSSLVDKRCPSCGLTKPVADFNRYTDASAPLTGWRYYSHCRSCQNEGSRQYGAGNRRRRNERLRDWRRRNPEAARAKDRRARLRSEYDLTPDEAEALMARFDGMCWLCFQRPAKVIDHCHETGAVRGALCHGCNSITVANADRDADYLARVARYLDQPCHADVLLELANP